MLQNVSEWPRLFSPRCDRRTNNRPVSQSVSQSASQPVSCSVSQLIRYFIKVGVRADRITPWQSIASFLTSRSTPEPNDSPFYSQTVCRVHGFHPANPTPEVGPSARIGPPLAAPILRRGPGRRPARAVLRRPVLHHRGHPRHRLRRLRGPRPRDHLPHVLVSSSFFGRQVLSCELGQGHYRSQRDRNSC